MLAQTVILRSVTSSDYIFCLAFGISINHCLPPHQFAMVNYEYGIFAHSKPQHCSVGELEVWNDGECSR